MTNDLSIHSAYQALFDKLDEAVCFIDRLPVRPDGRRDYRYVAMNPAMRRMFGVGDLTGQSIRDNFPDEVESWYDDFDQVLETGEPRRFERRSDPQGMMIEMFLSRVGDRGDQRLMVVMRDVTNVRAADVALRQSQDLLRSFNEDLEGRVEARTAERDRMWNTSPDLMVEASLDGVYQRANPAWLAILGFEPAEVVGKTAADFTHPADMNVMFEALSTAQADTMPIVSLRFCHKDGGYRWIQWVAAPSAGLIFAIGRDVTTQREAEAQLRLTEEALRQSQKMEAVGQLTGGVAHDFNNLLTIIRSSVDFLRRPDLPEERRQRYLDSASETVDRAAKLTGQLLAFARRQTLSPETFDAATKTRGVADMLDTVAGSKIKIVVDLPESPCPVRADISQFETALVNLAVNARDAMDGEGILTFKVVCGQPMPAIRGHAGASGDFTAISVTDTGAGIAADQLPRIFEPFYTTKAVGKGTGLGLSQVFGFAKQSGGNLEVASAEGEGSVFTLYLPELPAASVQTFAPSSPAEIAPDGQGQCILVVEDNVEIGHFCVQILEDLGYRSVLAQSAEAALKRLNDTPEAFSAVFSDVVMPGMGGFALALTLQQRLPDLPVILTSGYSQALAQEGDHGFPFLQKPYSAEKLAQALLRALT